MINHTINNTAEKKLRSGDDYKAGPFQWRLSASGKCPRLMDYELKHGRKPFEFQQILRMHRGTYFHTMWQDLLSEILVEQEEEVTLVLKSGRKILGHYDGYIEPFDAIYELKNISEFSFQQVVNQDKPIVSHIEQANIYAHLRGASNTLFHYFNASSCESAFFLVPTSAKLAAKTKCKWEIREIHDKYGIIDNRPYSDATESPCWFCDYKDECYKGFEGEVSKYKSANMDHDEGLTEKLANTISASATRLDNEKIEKKLKADIGKYLYGMGVSSASCNGMKVSVKLGKNKNTLVTVKGAKSEQSSTKK